MTLLRVVTSPDKVSAVLDALLQIGIDGLTVADARGASTGRHAVSYRGDEYGVSFIARAELQIVVDDERCSDAINEILEVARHVTTGENRIAVLPIEAAYRIRTGAVDYRREPITA
jgi:nitrogen regulatory protein P-II 1